MRRLPHVILSILALENIDHFSGHLFYQTDHLFLIKAKRSSRGPTVRLVESGLGNEMTEGEKKTCHEILLEKKIPHVNVSYNIEQLLSWFSDQTSITLLSLSL